MFLEKSNLTVDEAFEFINMKYNQACSPKYGEEVDKEFIVNLAKEAKEWKDAK